MKTKTKFTHLVILLLSGITTLQSQTHKFQNTNLSFEVRVDDLVSQLTLEEKVAQMLNAAPAIPRLNIPAYDWWNETLHGVARTPFKTTVFPQAIAMAATFDKNSLFKMADYSALEGRAIYNKALEMGINNQRYVGLTYWTPNINIFRDPRWGRGQETYGEDPYLTAMLGDYFVRGLQGDDPKYLKAAACAKHYAVHSGPEPLRHTFDVDVTPFDLWDTYLPAFKKLVTESEVAGVMCAYNAFRTQPCCASDILMTDILRKEWKFTGYVTSDCWAIDDFFKNHKTHPDAASASADAVFHGTDIDCGTDAYKALVTAVKNGQISEEQIDISVKRLFMIRFRLGMFDPAQMVKYAQTSSAVLESKEHSDHALKMARQSMVLLKNTNNTLPLNKSKVKKIAVLGPNADNEIAILGNYNGNPSKLTTVLQGIKDKVGANTQIVYEQATTFTNDTLLVYTDLKKQFKADGKQGFKAEYFNNISLEGKPIATRQEENIDHFWQEGSAIFPNLKANNFSARYSTQFTAHEDAVITFEIAADDGYKFIVDGKEVLNAWSRNRWGAKKVALKTTKNTTYNLVLEYWQGDGKANVALKTGNYTKTNFDALAAKFKDFDAIVYVGGISPQLEGEEMPVNDPGFHGGDRTSILLPQVQTNLMKALNKTGKPLVFVMMTGSAIAIPWETENVPAILNSWYGGQAAGTAVADVLFGDYNPAGRLPITFYKGDADLPDFNNYEMTNRTYRYFTGTPLYGFGYGLSYSKFKYDQFVIKAGSKKQKNTIVSVRITNASDVDGEEVPQLYLLNKDSKITIASKNLKGFDRIALKAGESKIVQFTLTPNDLTYVTAAGIVTPLKGELTLSIGGYQPDELNEKSSNILTKTFKL